MNFVIITLRMSYAVSIFHKQLENSRVIKSEKFPKYPLLFPLQSVIIFEDLLSMPLLLSDILAVDCPKICLFKTEPMTWN